MNADATIFMVIGTVSTFLAYWIGNRKGYFEGEGDGLEMGRRQERRRQVEAEMLKAELDAQYKREEINARAAGGAE